MALQWEEVESAAKDTGFGAYVSTAGPDGRPHVAFVSTGFRDGHVWFVTNRGSRKARNVAAGSAVAIHWPVGNHPQVFARGDAELHDSAALNAALWSDPPVPFDLSRFFSGPDDPQMVWVEVNPTSASIQRQGGVRPDTWTA